MRHFKDQTFSHYKLFHTFILSDIKPYIPDFGSVILEQIPVFRTIFKWVNLFMYYRVPAGIFYENDFIKCLLKNLIETIGILQPKNITFGRFG